jgi:hypothetical protein
MRGWMVLAALVVLSGCSSKAVNAPAGASRTVVAQPPAVVPAMGATLVGANPEPVAPPEMGDPAPPAYAPLEMRIPDGAVLRVRLDRAMDTRRNRAGDEFTATLTRPVVAHGVTVVAAETRFRGHVTQAAASGRLKGRAVLALTLDSFSSHGRVYHVRTSEVERVGKAHRRRNETFIGGGAELGAMAGAIAGGAKGLGIGALAGAGVGTAGAAATGKEEIGIPAEAVMIFRMQ